jgi:zinc transporter 1/2/3
MIISFLTGSWQLFTHANLMFANECLGEQKYEATAAAILMAGLFLSFLVDFIGLRFIQWKTAKKSDTVETVPVGRGWSSPEMLNLGVLEAGIIFHSLRKRISPFSNLGQ